MTTKELFTPRYEVIAHYPDSPFEIGDTLLFNGVVFGTNKPQEFVRNPCLYKSLFRPMAWWEKRKIDDMPKKIARVNDGIAYDIIEWDFSESNVIGWTGSKHCMLSLVNSVINYIPID